MKHTRYELQVLAQHYQENKSDTTEEFIKFLQQEIIQVLQKYIQKPSSELENKANECREKLLNAIKEGKYDTKDLRKRVSDKVTPRARIYAAEIKKTLQLTTNPANPLKTDQKDGAGNEQLTTNNEQLTMNSEENIQIKNSEQNEIIQSVQEKVQKENIENNNSEVMQNTPEIPKEIITPRPYQMEALEKMYDFVKQRSKDTLDKKDKEIASAFLLHQTMGTGKTIEMGMFMERFAKNILPKQFPGEKLRVLVLSNKIDTIQRQYTTLFPGRDRTGGVFSQDFADTFYVKEFHSSATRKTHSAVFSKGKKREKHNMMIMSTFQSASDGRIQKIVDKHGQFHLIRVDEAHHLPAPEFKQTAIQYIQPHKNNKMPIMPVTTGTSTSTLEQIVGKPLVEYTLPMYLASEYSPYVEYSMILRPDLSQADIEAIHEKIIEVQGEKNVVTKNKKTTTIVDTIDKMFVQFDSMDSLIDDITSRIENLEGTVYFCPSIKFAEELTEAINNKIGNRFHARSYHSDDRYSDAFESFRKGELSQIVTVDMLNESVHPGNINNIILLRRTDSFIVYFQQLGRGLTGKKVNVLDYTGSFKNFITAHDLYTQIRKNSHSRNTTTRKKYNSRFSIVTSQANIPALNKTSNSMELNILSMMRQAREMRSGIIYTKASKENIIELRKSGILKDEDLFNHIYPAAAKRINEAYKTNHFIVPESIKGLIGALGGDYKFDVCHEYVLSLLQEVDYIRGRPYMTSEWFLQQVKNENIPLEVLHESQRADFAVKKNATEEFPFLLYVKFRHLCQMMMGIGREGQYTTEMFHIFLQTEKLPEYAPFATIEDYKRLYKEGKIPFEILKLQHRTTFAQTFNKNSSAVSKVRLHEHRSTLKNLVGYNDGKYVQKIVSGEELKRKPSKSELLTARNQGVILPKHLNRKKRPSHAEFLNETYKDSPEYPFTFPLTFDVFIKIMEEDKYMSWKENYNNYSRPQGYIQSLFNGKEYKPKLPKATNNQYIQLAKEGIIRIDLLGQFTRHRFARMRNRVYSQSHGFMLHEVYQSAISAIINANNRKVASTQEEYEPLVKDFFVTNKPEGKYKETSAKEGLGGGYSPTVFISKKTETMITEFKKQALEAEKKEDRKKALDARQALKSLDGRNKEYQNKAKEMLKKVENMD